MAFCPTCGSSVDDSAVICMNCGCSLGNGGGNMGVGFYGGSQAPAYALNTNRGLLKLILLSAITFGIYGIVVMSSVSTDINLIAGKYDGKRTMHFCLVYFIFTGLTLGIVPLVWYHKLSARIGNELYRRGINYSFGAGSLWGWGILGSLIFVGPLIYTHKLLHAMNLLSMDYNQRG